MPNTPAKSLRASGVYSDSLLPNHPMGLSNRNDGCPGKETAPSGETRERLSEPFDMAGFSRTAIVTYGETSNIASVRSAVAEPCCGLWEES